MHCIRAIYVRLSVRKIRALARRHLDKLSSSFASNGSEIRTVVSYQLLFIQRYICTARENFFSYRHQTTPHFALTRKILDIHVCTENPVQLR